LQLLGLGPLLGLFSPAGLVGALEPGYAAPEVYAGELSPLSDVYALGALLYRALTGSPPGDGVPGSLAPVRGLRPDLNSELAQVIVTAMAHAPEARWQSATALEAALRGVECAGEQDRAVAGVGMQAAISTTPTSSPLDERVPARPAVAANQPVGSLPPSGPAVGRVGWFSGLFRISGRPRGGPSPRQAGG
jgi:serine/threonine-protein kinase